MLVLTRKSGQIIEIGNDTEVTVLEIEGGKVRLGISAPEKVKVRRKEIGKKPKTAIESEPVSSQ